MSSEIIVILTEDPVVVRNLTRVAVADGYVVQQALGTDDLALAVPPVAVVLNLEQAETTELVKQMKARWPEALVAGFLLNPLRELWEVGEAAGCDLVATRGALANQLRQKLTTWETERDKRRLRLFDLADIAGRLGVVARLDQEQGVPEPVAIYHLRNQIFAVCDACPHAGALLSTGELDGSVVTCPLHGSQFDVRTGERLRGPADLEIKTFVVGVEETQVFLRL